MKDFYHEFQNMAIDNPQILSSDFTFENSRLVDLIQRMIEKDVLVHMSTTENGWSEFDTDMDYKVYNELKENNELDKIIRLNAT